MRRLLGLILPVALAACGGEPAEDTAAAAAAAQQDSVAIVLATYSPAMFDTIEWQADTARTNRGAVVWMFSCRKCHGDTGHGDGGFVAEGGDTIRPPNFIAPTARLTGDRQELIKYIYAGNANGMPHWGATALKVRDMDAVAAYIQEMLVPMPATPTS